MRQNVTRWGLLPLAAALLLGACGGESGNAGAGAGAGGRPSGGASSSGKDGKSAGPPREVSLVPVIAKGLEQRLRVTGTLAADEQVTVASKVPGRLATLRVDLGSAVRQGQALAELETHDYKLRVEQAESALAQARALLGLGPQDSEDALKLEETATVKLAQATLEEARIQLKRTRALTTQGLLPKAELDSAQASYLRAESNVQNAREQVQNRLAVVHQRRSELALAEQQLSETAIVSPLTGVVQERKVNPGEFLTAGAPLLTVVRINPLRLRTEVPERDAPQVKVGQVVRFQLDGQDTRYEGRIARVAPALREQSRVLTVEAEIPNPGDLRAGSFVRAEIIVNAQQAGLVVPEEAVVSFAGLDKVLTVADGKAVEKLVKLGRKQAGLVEVLEGVTEGLEVVRSPGSLQQGMPVVVVPVGTPAGEKSPEGRPDSADKQGGSHAAPR